METLKYTMKIEHDTSLNASVLKLKLADNNRDLLPHGLAIQTIHGSIQIARGDTRLVMSSTKTFISVSNQLDYAFLVSKDLDALSKAMDIWDNILVRTNELLEHYEAK